MQSFKYLSNSIAIHVFANNNVNENSLARFYACPAVIKVSITEAIDTSEMATITQGPWVTIFSITTFTPA